MGRAPVAEQAAATGAFPLIRLEITERITGPGGPVPKMPAARLPPMLRFRTAPTKTIRAHNPGRLKRNNQRPICFRLRAEGQPGRTTRRRQKERNSHPFKAAAAKAAKKNTSAGKTTSG